MLTLIEAILLGFMTGLSGVTFPGPVFVFIMQQSLCNGFKSGFIATIAHAFVGLIVLILVIATGITTFFGSPGFQLYIGLIGGLSLIILGILILRNSLRQNQTIKLNNKNPFYHHPFFGGLIVSISNPQFFVWWAVIGLPGIGIAHALSGITGIYGWTAGILVSVFTWYGGISYIASRGKRYVPHWIILLISLVCSLFLMISGGYLLAKYFLKII
jgi:threonine/homoserine/homoserine lactone efflux protein